MKEFLLKDHENRYFLWTAIIGIIIQLIFFKYWYPFASYINGDSYSYLISAHLNNIIDTYPIGYPRFIRLFSVFTRSDTALVVFQYILLQSSILSFTFSLFYFYSPGRTTKITLFLFMLFNPVFLYLANYISSDALFLSLSIIWFTILLWIIHYPTNKLIILHGLVLFLAFTVRYNALFYPIISCIAFLFYKKKIFIKITGLIGAIFLIFCYIEFNSNQYYELCGKKQFTPFSGWQIANNAMYAYKFVPNDDIYKVPDKFKALDKMVRDYFDSTKNNKKHPEEQWMASTVYMWTPSAPLRLYMHNTFVIDTINDSNELKYWATIAPFYKDYGTYLIKKYPLAFAQYYLLPNALKYYAPPIEFLQDYSTGRDQVHPIAQQWFEYKNDKITTIFKDFRVNVLDFYPIMVGTMNVLFFLGFISFLILEGYKKKALLGKAIFLVVCLWMVNFGFSVFASPIALRFQLFPILIMTSFTFLFIEYLIKEASQKESLGELH